MEDMKYNDALERAKNAIKECGDNIESIKVIKSIFPELNESEDEKLRKNLVEFLDELCHLGTNTNFDRWSKADCADWINWLEKMKDFDKKLEKAYKANSKEIFDYGYKAAKAELGKEDNMDPRWKYAYDLIIADEMYQMSMNDEMVEEARTKASEALSKIGYIGDLLFNKTDKTECNDNKDEPIFEVGDWIVNKESKEVFHIIKNLANNYETIDIEGNEYHIPHHTMEDYRLWSINDAKDGDILVDEAKDELGIFIFKNIDPEIHAVKTYCTFFTDDAFDNGCLLYIDTVNTKPATKEQQEKLFLKMKEEGYAWDVENKELKKLMKKLDNSAQICNNYSKFKVGDWVVDEEDNHVYQVRRIISDGSGNPNGLFSYDLSDNGYFYFTKTDYHLWSIYDIKNGDVLAFNNDCIKLVKEIIYNPISGWRVSCWCDLVDGEFDVVEYSTGIEGLHPATKEQCDKLFKIMAVNGYEWDADKKELKKTPNALEECEIEHIEHGKYYYCIKDYYYGVDKKVSKGEVVQALKGMPIMGLGVKANEYFIPVKSIVDAKHDWSDEDEYMLNETIQHLEELIRIDKAKHCACDVQYYQRDIDWIKSLKQRYTWKPSEKQMNALDSTLQYSQVSHDSYEHLNSLFNDLKKLK